MISRSPVAEHDDFSGEPKNEARRTNNKAVCISNDSTLMSHKLLISTPYRRSPVTASIRHADCFWSSLAEPANLPLRPNLRSHLTDQQRNGLLQVPAVDLRKQPPENPGAEPFRCQNPYQFSLLCAQRDK